MINDLIKQLKTVKPNTKGVTKEASVLIPIICRDGAWQILFEKRALTLKSQPGEVCFPGGIVEKNESPMTTAIRETCEELNLETSNIEILGQMDSVLTNFDMIIHCFIGIVHKDYDAIKYSQDEVESIFTLPIFELLQIKPDIHYLKSRFDPSNDFPFHTIPDGHNYNFKHKTYPVVFYHLKQETIWGLTARMLYDFVLFIDKNLEWTST